MDITMTSFLQREPAFQQSTQQVTQQYPSGTPGNYSYPDQLSANLQQTNTMVKIIIDIPKNTTALRHTFRGEALQQLEDGTNAWIQIVKPMFVQMDVLNNTPLTREYTMNNGSVIKEFIPNDEAIEEVLSMLFFMGMNSLTPITNLSEDIVLDDLREFECKLAGLLALKQVAWGIDKQLLPMVISKIKTLIQDVRYLSVEGTTLKALSKSVSRIEQVLEGEKKQLFSGGYR